MSLGKRGPDEKQEPIWIEAAHLATPAGHPFYERLNRLLSKRGFDAFAESACESFYAKTGRPGLAPGVYFRALLVGYFEGIDSERGIAWRTADSLALRSFLGFELGQATPDHSTISRTRRLIDVETHRKVFLWVLGMLAEEGLLQGNTVSVDGTTLEANAALRSIVRRDSGQGYDDFLKDLAKESGIETPTREQLAKLDRKRKKKGNNDDWKNPHDPDAQITKMKDGRTHLAHKAEHAVDLETGAVLAVTLQPATAGDTNTLHETLTQCGEHIREVAADIDNRAAQMNPEGPAELVLDKGYHSNDVMVILKEVEVRSYCSEPDRGRRNWKGKQEDKAAVYQNRRRIRGERGKRLLRQRGERVERSFAHMYETGAMRRTHLRRHDNIIKRLLIHAGAFNLGLVMRKLLGNGTPRGFQGRLQALLYVIQMLCRVLTIALTEQRSRPEASNSNLAPKCIALSITSPLPEFRRSIFQIQFNHGLLASKSNRLIIDTHLEVWTIDPKFPFHNPEHPDAKPEMAAPVENEVEEMREFGLRYAVLINQRNYGWDNSYISYSLHKYPDLFVAHGLINPEDPNVADRLRYWVKEHGFQGMRFSPLYHPKSTWLNSKALYPLWHEAERLGAVFNFYILPHQMPMLEDMAGRFPGVKVVVDHLGEPNLKSADPWSDFRKMYRLKNFLQVWISASEPYEISLQGFPYRDTWPFFKAVYEEFGGKQLIWGTGYPRPRWELPMDKELEFVDSVLDFYTAEDRKLLLSENAMRIWQFPGRGNAE